MGADSGRPRPDARDEARLHHPWDALHGVVAGAGRRDATGTGLRDPERCAPDLGGRVDERRDDRPCDRRDRERRGSRRGRGRPRLLDQPRPHRRLLRRACACHRGEPSRRCPEPEGSRWAAHPGAGAYPGAGAAGRRPEPAARGPLTHDGDDGRGLLRRSRRAGCLVPLHRSEAARERNVAAFGGADDREPARAGVSRRPRRRRAARGLALLHEPCSRARSARRLSPSSTTSPSTSTSCRAG